MKSSRAHGTDVPGLGRILNLPAVATANELGLNIIFEYGKIHPQHGQGGKSLAGCLGSW